MVSALEGIADCCVRHLCRGGYLTEEDSSALMSVYMERLGQIHPEDKVARDFLAFVGAERARRHSRDVEAEVSTMQKVLRSLLKERVHHWSFGPLPGRADSLYEHCPAMRQACSALSCPSVIAGEPSIIHVASINPVAAVFTARMIKQEIHDLFEGEAPFVFPLIVDLPTWNVMLKRHFHV